MIGGMTSEYGNVAHLGVVSLIRSFFDYISTLVQPQLTGTPFNRIPIKRI